MDEWDLKEYKRQGKGFRIYSNLMLIGLFGSMSLANYEGEVFYYIVLLLSLLVLFVFRLGFIILMNEYIKLKIKHEDLK